MDALRIDVTVDESLLRVLPSLRPLLGHRTELIVLDQGIETPARPAPELTLEEFLATRLKRPEGVPPVTVEDMQQAIAAGALDGNV